MHEKSSYPIVHTFRCLEDNVGVLLHDPDSNTTVSIDAPDEQIISEELNRFGWSLTDIFITHHHFDHIGGVLGLKQCFDCRVVGPLNEASKIEYIDTLVRENSRLRAGSMIFAVFDLPGHTASSVGYGLVLNDVVRIVFVGDTLFEMGCGRLFEGTAHDMWRSINKLMAMPDDTIVYYGHDYGLTNAQFALELEPSNRELQVRLSHIQSTKEFRSNTTITEEKRTNPFMRVECLEIMKSLNLVRGTPEEVFAEMRSRRNVFRPKQTMVNTAVCTN